MEEMTLGKKIKQLRENECLTIRELASLMGKDFTLVAKWESDKVVPSLHSIKALAFALDVDAKVLLAFIR